MSNIGHVVARGHELQLTGFFSYAYPFAGKILKDDSNCFAMGKDSLLLLLLLCNIITLTCLLCLSAHLPTFQRVSHGLWAGRLHICYQWQKILYFLFERALGLNVSATSS